MLSGLQWVPLRFSRKAGGDGSRQDSNTTLFNQGLFTFAKWGSSFV